MTVYAGQWTGEFFGLPSLPGQSFVYNAGTLVLASLYTDRIRTAAAPNPYYTDALGNGSFFAEPALYDQVCNGVSTRAVVPLDPQDLAVEIAARAAADTSLTSSVTAETIARAAADTVAPVNAQTLDYTVVLTDAGKNVGVTAATGKAVTLPPNATVPFPVDTFIDITQLGAGAVTLTAGAGVTITGDTSTPALGATIRARKTGTNTWVAAIESVRTGTYVDTTTAQTVGGNKIGSGFWQFKSGRPWADPRAWGAIGDGTMHPLSEQYATLGAAQAVFPFATALTQSLDWAGHQAAINAGKRRLRSDDASYVFASNTDTVRLVSSLTIEGDDVRTNYETSGSYAFDCNPASSLDNVYISGISGTLRAGSTSGGLLNGRVNFQAAYRSAWYLEHVRATGVASGNSDPLIILQGLIGAHIKGGTALTAAVGLQIDSVNFASNATRIEDWRGAGCSVYAVSLAGGGLIFEGGTIESNSGRGLYVEGGNLVNGTWFEDNRGHHAVIYNGVGSTIRECRFFYHNAGGPGDQVHVLIDGAAPGNLFNHVRDCVFSNGTLSGFDVRVTANASRTYVTGGACVVDDQGVDTVRDGFTAGPLAHPAFTLPRRLTSRLNVVPPTTTATEVVASLGAPDAARSLTLYGSGHVAFTAADNPSSLGIVPLTNAFMFFLDAGVLKCFIRDGTGATFTRTLDVLPLANTWPQAQSFAQGVLIQGGQNLYFKNLAGVGQAGWAILATGTTLEFKEEASSISALAISASGTTRPLLKTTAGRPSAVTVGAGHHLYDTTLSRPVWSDGTNWLDATPGTLLANTQTANYVPILADAGKVVEMNVAGANTLTVPPNSSVAFPVGTVIEAHQYGAGQVTLTAGAGVTLRSNGAKLKIGGQYGSASLRKRATDEWVVSGDLTA